MTNQQLPFDDIVSENDTQTIPSPTPAEVTDITRMLSMPTQRRTEVSIGDADDVVDEVPQNIVGSSEFDQDKIDAIKDNTAMVAEASTAIAYDTDKLADAIIDLGDTLLTAGGPFLYQSLLSKQERTDLKQLAMAVKEAKVKKEKLGVSKAESDALILYAELQEYEELLPLSDAEKHSIKVPLREVLKSVSYQGTPQGALMMACGMIAIPRVIPLIPLILKKRKNNETESE
jgi:hypothetical protein